MLQSHNGELTKKNIGGHFDERMVSYRSNNLFIGAIFEYLALYSPYDLPSPLPTPPGDLHFPQPPRHPLPTLLSRRPILHRSPSFPSVLPSIPLTPLTPLYLSPSTLQAGVGFRWELKGQRGQTEWELGGQ